ncbi:MAG: RsmB/NOP family class I SAM-dependent RNA methyltransferase, partial [Hyphomicrobiales bacterium]|nr:RsmB/NOP family class I SAM-dependent RNA methyltransferase [Hyphomicrobiales bacterium]
KSSSAWLMGEASARAELLGMLRQTRRLDVVAIAALCSGERHAPAPLTAAERERLAAADLAGAPAHVAGDFPEWLAPEFEAAFGPEAVAEGRALAERAPVDLRANLLKTTREKALAALRHLSPEPTPLSPVGLRIAVRPDGRGPALGAEPAYVKGLIEVQDEGSQLAALLAEAKGGMQVLDLCAGAGGKTLALAAAMENHGQIYATDPDGRRLAPIFERLKRAGARNVQVRAPRGAADPLADLEGRSDLVLIDAPCSGSGAWRRNPDAKWRIRPGALAERIKDQDEILDSAMRFVKPGGRLVYVTCSLFKAENEERVTAFLERHADMAPLDAKAQAKSAGLMALAAHASPFGPGFRLTPRTTGTDGFYIAALAKIWADEWMVTNRTQNEPLARQRA